jgi:hypothetical protein
MTHADDLLSSLRAARARVEKLEEVLTEAHPWLLFYRDGKSLGEVVETCGGTVYDYSPWLTAPCIRIAQEANDRAAKAEAALADLKTEVREAVESFAKAAAWADEEGLSLAIGSADGTIIADDSDFRALVALHAKLEGK